MTKLLFALSITMASLSISAAQRQTISWGNIATLNIQEIHKQALSYVSGNITSLKNTKLKFLEASSQYRTEKNKFHLKAVFYHENSYVSGSEHKQTVNMGGNEKELVFIKIKYLLIYFNANGKAYKHEVISEQFPGTKEEFEAYIKSNSNK